MSEVLVVGDAIVDFVFGDVDHVPNPGEEMVASRFEVRPGGSAGYASLGLAAQDVDVRVSTPIGTDPLSEQWLTFMSDHGVNTELVDRIPDTGISTAAAILTDTDRSFVTYRGAAATTSVEPPDVGSADIVLISGFAQAPYLWSVDGVAAIQTLSESDAPILLDTNWSPSGWQEAFDEILPSIDYLLANDTEVRRLGGSDSISDAAGTLVDRGVGSCIIKAGEEGCLVVDTDGIKTVPTDFATAVDTCGAGDFFNAGFISALSAGASVTAAARRGNRVAGAAIGVFSIHEKLELINSLS
ncbi:MAG: carbohydrate kinase family protein [Halobacteriota archaeon]|uniref:carbohydrate kinase family protein n=1 Tax=Natronomonas sp. TaxID=2184060 RepID=UPI00397619EB